MANPTVPFSWQMPEATDLVTNLPADFEVFGQAVATDLQYLLGGTTGQVLAKASGTDLDFVWSADAAGMTNPMTTTADVIYSSSGSTPARLGIGTAGQVLKVNSGATAPEWATADFGLTLINTTTVGSGVTSTSLPADTFSATYTNYKFLFTSVTSCTADIALFFRLRSASTDESSASYSANGYRATSGLAVVNDVNQTSQQIGFIRSGFAERFFVSGELYRPKEAAQTMYATNCAIDNAGTFTNLQLSGLLNTATSYDSITFIYANGNVTGGKISVYGYNI
jgi:hypothetical protein